MKYWRYCEEHALGIALILAIAAMIIIPLSLGACAATNTGDSAVFYYHDPVHKVGIWIMGRGSATGIPPIAVLPDSAYSNVGTAWEAKP